MDWRLPTKRELNLVYNQKSNIGVFANVFYWSSTEFGYSNAWIQYFYNGNQNNYAKSDFNANVRAVRAF